MTLRVRAFDDGVAFAMEWDASGRDSITVMDELTEFAFAEEATTWSIPADFDSYEKLPSTAGRQRSRRQHPFTFTTDSSGIFGPIHEAALYDFPEMTLRRDILRRLDVACVAWPMPDGVKAVTPSRFTTPWRTIQIGRKATDLINSSMILNLNEPCRIDDISWIKPQKYIGVWWGYASRYTDLDHGTAPRCHNGQCHTTH